MSAFPNIDFALSKVDSRCWCRIRSSSTSTSSYARDALYFLADFRACLITAVSSSLCLAATFGSPALLLLRARHIIMRHLPPICAVSCLLCFALSSPPWPLVLPLGYSPAASSTRLLSHFTLSCTAYRSVISRNRSTRTVWPLPCLLSCFLWDFRFPH